MFAFQGLDDQRLTRSSSAPDNNYVTAADPIYADNSSRNFGDVDMKDSQQLTAPEELDSSEEPEENVDETLSLISLEHRDSPIIYETAPWLSSNRFELTGWPAIAWKRLFETSASNLSPWEHDILRGAYLESLIRSDISHLYKRVIIENMRHDYNEHCAPRPGRLAKCSCNSCWAENLLSISAGAVRPTIPYGYSPSRTAEKCERPSIERRVSFNHTQKTLTFDISNGKVFDLKEGETDLSGVHKELGEMITYASDGGDFYRADSQLYDSEDGEVLYASEEQDESETLEYGNNCDLPDEEMT